ncbi:universal stress protein [Fulvivirgaceae bacterium PWU5]|uniref:Universal stress protein n=1 Tax=Dawidia cretensis TaxID=2782350 RepID=A0AAP2GV37_9BACT|nr:universal stress protein [Dawidia cretensis]MBT1708402.1 universal stress protein [Dawidia cretensis]
MKNEIKNVLVATDFSAYATRTQHAAGTLCAQNDSRITLLYVLETSPYLIPENRLTPTLLPELASIADENLRKRAKILSQQYGIAVDAQVVCGNSADEILKVVKAENADIVITGIEERHAGDSSRKAIARRVAARTACPVLALDDTKEVSTLSDAASVINTKIKLYEGEASHRIRATRGVRLE